MHNVLDGSNKSDYYIGMSIPSRQSEFNPSFVVSSETILDYDETNPPQRQFTAQKRKRRQMRGTQTRADNNNNNRGQQQIQQQQQQQQQQQHVYDIKEEEEDDTTDDEEEDVSSHDDDDEDFISENGSNDEDEEIDDEYYDDDDSDDMKGGPHPRGTPAHNHSNPYSNPRSNPHTSNSHPNSGSHRGSSHHHNNTAGSSAHGGINQGQLNIIDNTDDTDAEYTQIQALQEQLQQQQRQLVIQSQQLKQLKHQIKNQDEEEVINTQNINNINTRRIQQQQQQLQQQQQQQQQQQHQALKPYHFEGPSQQNQYLNVSPNDINNQFSDSDDGITSGPFPTLSFDDTHSNNSQFVQQSNPNLNIPHHQTQNRTIHSVEHGSFNRQNNNNNNNNNKIKKTRSPKRLISPRTPKNPFSRNNSRSASQTSSPRGTTQDNNHHYHQIPSHQISSHQIPPHKRNGSGSSYKSSRSKKKSRKQKIDPINIDRNKNKYNQDLVESPINDQSSPSKSSSHHSFKRDKHSGGRTGSGGRGGSGGSGGRIVNGTRNTNQQSPKYGSSSSKKQKNRSHKNKDKNNTNSHKSRKSSNHRRDRERERDRDNLDDPNMKLNRKELNLQYATKKVHEATPEQPIPSPRSPIHSPPLSPINSPPLSPHSNHSHRSHSYESNHSFSNATTGQQHKLGDIALPSTYYNSEYGDNNTKSPNKGQQQQQQQQHKGAGGGAAGKSGPNDDEKGGYASNIADLFMDGIPELEFTVENIELHNKKLAAQRAEKKANKLKLNKNGSGSSKYHLMTQGLTANGSSFHHHQHQHQHLHHHHYHHGVEHGIDNNNNGDISSGDAALANIVGKNALKFNNSNGHHSGSIGLTNKFSGLSHLSGVSTDSQAMAKLFHPGNRMQFSKFKNKAKLQSSLSSSSKPNLNPESQYSTAAALDPLDELDNMDVLNNYDKHKELGNGTDAFVYEVVDRRDKSHVAMKLTKRKSGRYKTEIHLLHQLRTCPYVVKLLNCLENDNVYVLILEHAPMSLENLLLQRCTKHPMQERVAKTILSQILKGIRAIHNLGFVHKDIKPENILIFANRSERKLIAKVADFGFATRVAPDASISGGLSIDQLPREKYLEFEKHVRDRCGTPGFWPPELVTQLCNLKYSFKMDVFSAGVTLYRMLCNEMPFGIFETWKYNIDHRDGQKKLCKVKPNWKVISWIQSDNKYTPVLSQRKLSDIVKDLLRSMLRIRPEQRATVDICLQHEFFNKKTIKPHNSTNSNISNSRQSSHHNNHHHHHRHKSNSNRQSDHSSSSNSNNNRYSTSNSKHRKKKSGVNSNNSSKYPRSSNKMKAKG